MVDAVLDASALIAFIRGEPGADTVGARLRDACILTVAFAETSGKLLDGGFSLEDVGSLLDALPMEVVATDRSLAWRAGALRPATRARGLSLGDRFCLALAERERLPVLTADRAWAGLDLDVEVVLIR